ncbi:hypothetical protein FG386_000487 [Cryptosporidium ryanae]|uniref:uncharacterized protein n=1 Tax=Cryptosporidium ryanae TaxID=515981 RepID=UPI003519ED25|nr:hypothetical protein FG386_000487 [Cryptosporidium ryanae]
MRFLSLLLPLASLFLVAFAEELEKQQLRRGSPPSPGKAPKIEKIGLFVEGFTPESISRTKKTISVGLEGVEIVELLLSDLQSALSLNIGIFAAPSDVIPGSLPTVKQGMDIIEGFVQKGSLLFSQMSSSSVLCKEFIYSGESTTNSPFIYDGQCVGPLTGIGPFEKDSRAITIKVGDGNGGSKSNNAFTYGGFYFKDADKKENCIILAKATPRSDSEALIEFDESADPEAVVVACKHGNGAAILSGIYIDQNKSFLKSLLEKIPDQGKLPDVVELLSEVPEFSELVLGFLMSLFFTAAK